MTPRITRRFWLLKSEPDCFSYDDLAAAPGRTTHWSGVRNYQARNFMRDDMRVGDGVLFYHSSAEPPGVAGTAEIVRSGYPDHTALDPADDHFDPKSSESDPIWYMVDVRAVQKFDRLLPLPELRSVRALEKMELLRRGSRLSVQPVTAAEWRAIARVARVATHEQDAKEPSTRRSSRE